MSKGSSGARGRAEQVLCGSEHCCEDGGTRQGSVRKARKRKILLFLVAGGDETQKLAILHLVGRPHFGKSGQSAHRGAEPGHTHGTRAHTSTWTVGPVLTHCTDKKTPGGALYRFSLQYWFKDTAGGAGTNTR